MAKPCIYDGGYVWFILIRHCLSKEEVDQPHYGETVRMGGGGGQVKEERKD